MRNYDQDFISVKEAASISGLSPHSIRLLITQKKLNGVKLLNRWRVERDSINKLFLTDQSLTGEINGDLLNF